MTKDFQKKVILFLGIFLFLFLSSCSWLKKEQVQRQTGQKAKQAQLELEGGDFQRAIDVYKEIHQQYPQDPTVQISYIKTLESIKSSGDQAFERKNFELAGNIYEILAKNWLHFADLSHSLSFKKNFLGIKIITCRSFIVEKQAWLYLEAGDFQRAIDVYKEIYQQYPQDPKVRSSYTKIVESIKSSGDRAFERSDFALAGCIYQILLKNFSSFNHLRSSFSFNREYLTKKIKSLEKVLFEKGLEQYRSGNLNQAISIWKSILAFDPENQEIKKAVDMAILQSKNLKETKY